MVSASLLVLVGLGPFAVLAQQQQKFEPPKWMSDEGKDLFSDIMTSQHPFDEATCEARDSLLKTLIGKSGQEAGQVRYTTLRELGICEYNKGNYEKAKKRIDSGIGELNLPNDDLMLTNQDLAPTGLLREAAKHMIKHELTQAATAVRRSREISERNLKKIIKMIHKQMSQGQQNVPPVDNMIAEISGLGRTGQFLPMLMGQAPILKQEMSLYEQVDAMCEGIDKQLAGFAPQLKAIRKTLDTSKGSKGGTLMYVRGLVTDTVAPSDRLQCVEEMMGEKGVLKKFQEEGPKLEKSVTLLKRSKEGSGCAKDKGMAKTCKAIVKIEDLKSNVFGETRVIVMKGKKQQLETCSTNANLGIIIAAQDGMTANVGKMQTALLGGLPIVVDFCQEVTLEGTGAVLFAQAWHPEYAAVERTTEIRARAKTFDLSEDETKEATKIVNEHGKKKWEKAGKLWREDSDFIKGMQSSLKGAKDAEKKKAEDEAEAKKKEDEANDEGRKKNLEALEKKRADKKAAQEAAEKKKAERKKQLEEERANRDPWLNDPEVLAAEKNLEQLKEARRDANAKLEFDLTAQLTKDISTAERTLKKATKAAKKAHKKAAKGEKAADGDKKADDKADKAADKSEKVADIKKKLEDVKQKKKEAAENEDFGAAKKLKVTQKDLEDQLKKLEL